MATLTSTASLCIISVILLSLLIQTNLADNDRQSKVSKKVLPKDPLYITDMDLENLYDQWEDSDEDQLPPDELPPHRRPPPKFKPPPISGEMGNSKNNPEDLLKASKQGKTAMAFVSIANNPTRQETELLTERWQVGLVNAHMKCQRFVIADDRALFVFEDGSLAYEAKPFLLEQPELKEYSIENQSWHGKGYPTEPAYPTDGPREPTKPTLTTRKPIDREL